MAAEPSNDAGEHRRSWLSLHFGRVVSKGKLIPEIDGLRFVAIFAVVMHHLNGYIVESRETWDSRPRDFQVFHTLHSGNFGVQMFFAISGFVLGMPFLLKTVGNRPFELKRYFTRRITRLEPPFVINLVAISALLWATGKETITQIIPHFFASVFYLHGLIYERWSTINGVSWSLEIEVQFYIIAPLISVFIYRPGRVARRLLMVALIGGVVLAKCFWGETAAIRWKLSLPYYFDYFLIGMLLADIFVTDWKRSPKRTYLHDAFGAGMFLLIIALLQWDRSQLLILPFVVLGFYVCCFRGILLSRFLSNEVVVVIGGMCYTCYLYHFFVISFVGRFTSSSTYQFGYPVTLAIQSALILPAVVIVTTVLFWLFERPFMAWSPFRKTTTEKNDNAKGSVED